MKFPHKLKLLIPKLFVFVMISSPVFSQINISETLSTPTTVNIKYPATGNYDDAITAKWGYYSDMWMPIILNFNTLDLAQGDYIYVYDYDVLDINTVPKEYVMEYGSVSFIFVSDVSVTAGGFDVDVISTTEMLCLTCITVPMV